MSAQGDQQFKSVFSINFNNFISIFQILDEAKDNVLCLDVNSTEIATGSADGNARIYDLREGRLFVDFVEHSVTAVNLTADNVFYY